MLKTQKYNIFLDQQSGNFQNLVEILKKLPGETEMPSAEILMACLFLKNALPQW